MSRTQTVLLLSLACVGLLLLTGCFAPEDGGFVEVRTAISEKSNTDIRWIRTEEEAAQAQETLRRLLEEDLTPDTAAQVALLHNQDLQATYEDLGVARADLVQAGLLSNPVFEWLTKAHDGDTKTVEIGVGQNFLSIFMIPLKRKIAWANLEAAKARVTMAVLDLEGEVRSAFYSHQADLQMLRHRRDVLDAMAAFHETAKRLKDAGNIKELELANARALHEQARLDVSSAELAVADSREQLNRLLGLYAADTRWTLREELPAIPDDAFDTSDIEKRAILASLGLAARWERIRQMAGQYSVEAVQPVVPALHAGYEAEHELEEDIWLKGPRVELTMPLFDMGQARRGRAKSEVRRAMRDYEARAVEVRSRARLAARTLLTARKQALYYREIMVPLREKITQESLLQYNGMQMGTFQLLVTKRMEIDTRSRYIERLRDYWIARTNLEQLLKGRMTGAPVQMAAPAGGVMDAGGGSH